MLNRINQSAALSGKGKRRRSPFERGQAAVDELRRVLPTIIAFMDQPFTSEVEGSAFHMARLKHRDALQAMLNGLLDLAPKVPSNSLTKQWQSHAVSLWLSYRLIVGTHGGRRIGASQHGPAVRFIRLALYRAGWGEQDLATIEKAVQRQRTKKSDQDKSDMRDLSADNNVIGEVSADNGASAAAPSATRTAKRRRGRKESEND